MTTSANRTRAISLYRGVLQAARQTFMGDQATNQAWRSHMRTHFRSAKEEQDAEKLEMFFKEAEDIVRVLKSNVVQGAWRDESQAYRLRMTSDTELGSYEATKAGREAQMEALRAAKGTMDKAQKCSSSASSSNSSRTSRRPFSTSCSSPLRAPATSTATSSFARAFSTSSRALELPYKKGSAPPLPRPVPKFPSTIILSDGSSIRLTTTSPRSLQRLTRDPTNHPLWNPSMERRGGAGDEDESGRLSRFRKRFQNLDQATPQASSGAGAGVEAGATAPAPAPARKSQQWDQSDLEWMSGGREARAGSAVVEKRTKGKK
ncbi:hypothetical protein IE81DRAFT_324481 [Ceraceosorus guamensis]|uniref:Mitochondrial zinc maintenance protein 1, mitochondrial n=1 Tax=Ceraceosorus guamensis TaxID=1522189 RepID=A0A316VVI0_9BASI|nr:hypothetical protein IE81DRAFT_324481 [Ceraceosorus guamensis]PWN41490.1 hypothetical protein IE81DRAFT_324481 [Ceraceosorus guamensis]